MSLSIGSRFRSTPFRILSVNWLEHDERGIWLWTKKNRWTGGGFSDWVCRSCFARWRKLLGLWSESRVSWASWTSLRRIRINSGCRRMSGSGRPDHWPKRNSAELAPAAASASRPVPCTQSESIPPRLGVCPILMPIRPRASSARAWRACTFAQPDQLFRRRLMTSTWEQRFGIRIVAYAPKANHARFAWTNARWDRRRLNSKREWWL